MPRVVSHGCVGAVCRRRSCPRFAGGAAASLISVISCSTDVATSRGYALELFGALSLQSLRVAITTAPVVPSTKTLTPLLPTPLHLPIVRIRRDAPTIPAGIPSPGRCVGPLRPQSKYSKRRLATRTIRDGAEPDVLADGGEGGLLRLVAGYEAFDDGPEVGGVVGFV